MKVNVFENEKIDIHKIIDDAMEKKDRRVTVFISDIGMTINVNPIEEDGTWWILEDGSYTKFRCSNCGQRGTYPTTYCPHCGDQTKGVKQLEEVK